MSRRKFIRPYAERSYKRLYIIASEGTVSEPEYFRGIAQKNTAIKAIYLYKNNKNSPTEVLENIKQYLNRTEIRSGDEAWIVVDKDSWTDSQLKELYEWSCSKPEYGFALSNPNFEYWLLLHFEDGKQLRSERQCMERLKKYIPNYNKHIPPRIYDLDKVNLAIERARKRDNSPAERWPIKLGCTNVYILVEKLIN